MELPKFSEDAFHYNIVDFNLQCSGCKICILGVGMVYLIFNRYKIVNTKTLDSTRAPIMLF